MKKNKENINFDVLTGHYNFDDLGDVYTLGQRQDDFEYFAERFVKVSMEVQDIAPVNGFGNSVGILFMNGRTIQIVGSLPKDVSSRTITINNSLVDYNNIKLVYFIIAKLIAYLILIDNGFLSVKDYFVDIRELFKIDEDYITKLAMALLMPKLDFKKYIENLNLNNDNAIQQISDHYCVPLELVLLRIKYLK